MKNNDKPSATIHSEVSDLLSDYGVQVRQPIDGGLSSASVFLVDSTVNEQSRLAVVKLVSESAAKKERAGDEIARSSWMKPFLPDLIHTSAQHPVTSRCAILFALANDRQENCQTLRKALELSYSYAATKVLPAIMNAYRDQASTSWKAATPEHVTLSKIFKECAMHELPSSWLDEWTEAGLPTAAAPGFVFEDRSERWPNPIAFLMQDSLWPEDSSLHVSIPWMIEHGDLNPQNILCPTINRAQALNMLTGFRPQHILKHLSLIDTPHCRLLPFTFDPAFTAAWLDFLLPKFDTRANQDTVLKSFAAVLDFILTETSQHDLPLLSENYSKCINSIWLQVSRANIRMIEDVRRAFIATLASASIWQAIKAFKNDREAAVAKLCMAALCLQKLLPDFSARLPRPDFEYWSNDIRKSKGDWTDSAQHIARQISDLEGRRQLVVVLGTEWEGLFGLPTTGDAKRLAVLDLDDLQQQLPNVYGSIESETLSYIGALPLAAVLDYSMFGEPQSSISTGVSEPSYVRPIGLGPDDPDWRAQDAVYYFPMRGSIHNPSSLAWDARVRNRRRSELRPKLMQMKSRRPGELVVLYAGATAVEFSECNAYLHDIWPDGLNPIYIGTPNERLKDELDDWQVQHCTGTPQDFITACSAFISDASRSRELNDSVEQVRHVEATEVQDVGLDSPVPTSLHEIPLADGIEIGRAGRLLYHEDLATYESVERDPQQFFVGHRVLVSEVHKDVVIDRDFYLQYLKAIQQHVLKRRPILFQIPTSPAAGGSTLLVWIAYHLAYTTELRVPTLILESSGDVAFEAIERLYRCLSGPFVVVADPQDVAGDVLRALRIRAASARIPAIFVTTTRIFKVQGSGVGMPVLPVELNERELAVLLGRLAEYCPGVRVDALLKSDTRSMFLLTLEAFQGERVNVDEFVERLMTDAEVDAGTLLATIALFSRYAHRSCTAEFLQSIVGRRFIDVQRILEPFEQLLVLRESLGWACRHEELSRRILQYHLTKTFETDLYRHRIADFVCNEILDSIGDEHAGGAVAAEYVWALLNPQLESDRGFGLSANSGEAEYARRIWEDKPTSRLISSTDGLPYNPDREKVFRAAAAAFPTHALIVSHCGKYLSETEKKYDEADRFLLRAYELESRNGSISHMIGKRYMDELRQIVLSRNADERSVEERQRIRELAGYSHEWFDRARELDVGSEYNYTTPIQLDMILIDEAFHRLRLRRSDVEQRVDALTDPGVAMPLNHAEVIASEGLRYIEASKEARRAFNVVRSQLQRLRGDVTSAINHLRRAASQRVKMGDPLVVVQLSRYLHERGERSWVDGKRELAVNDFKEAAERLDTVLQDPAQAKNVKLWFDCARYLSRWNRNEFLRRLHEYHERNPHNLDTVFLLMCLYFCEAVQTRSPESWRGYERYQQLSAERSSFLPVRRSIREWLVNVDREHRVYPSHLFREESSEAVEDKGRVRLTGKVREVRSGTMGSITLDHCGFDVFFQPRIKNREFYQSDEGRTSVEFLLCFTYEKPQAFDVRRIE